MGPSLDERVRHWVDILVALLVKADLGEILKDFGKRTGKEDPVVHFYEDFLQKYDPKVREMRGVYYTPEPVVQYIVRSIDHPLKTRFNKPDGLADKNVYILDPACGTGTFLYYVIRHIHDVIVHKKKQKGRWNTYVSQNLLTRVFGFELLMAPYAVAHLKLGLLLKELGYKFDTDKRLGIYLTNTLEEAIKKSETMFAQFIAEEANAAADIKREKKIMVVLGNPPYSGHSANKGKWISNLMEDYKRDCPELYKPAQAKWLQDDYVKFLRFGQWRIDRTGEGILGFITNHGYLDNPTFRGMRQQLMKSFTDIHIMDLHGSSKKKEKAPDGSKDENVFDTQQGVSIGLFVKEKGRGESNQVKHTDLWGLRKGKYKTLAESDITNTPWVKIAPRSKFFLFIPQDTNLLSEYEKYPKISEIMNRNGDPAPGIVTTHDQFAISWTKDEAIKKVEKLLSTNTEQEARSIFRLCSQSQWSYRRAKKELADGSWKSNIFPILYRPFNFRWTVYDPNVAVHRRERVMSHMLAGKNLGFLVTKQTRDKWDILVTSHITTHKSLSAYDITSLLPLYLFEGAVANKEKQGSLLAPKPQHNNIRANINPVFLTRLERSTGLESKQAKRGDLKKTFGPEDVFHYIYAVLHSPTYRERYAEFLKIDFPRVPLTSDKKLFRKLCELGGELVWLHLMESPKLSDYLTSWPESGDNVVEKPRYEDNHKRVYINKTQYFEGVPKEVWEFHIGGYQVCQKWLKDRKGRKLSDDDLDHYQKIVVALSETIRLMKEIDEAIPGWPLK